MQTSGPNRGKDRLAKIGIMMVRLGFVIALVLGLGFLFNAWSPLGVLQWHMLAGYLVVFGILIVALRFTALKRPGIGPVWGAAVLALVGSYLGQAAMRGMGSGIIHMIVMLLTVGLAEMGVARVNKAG